MDNITDRYYAHRRALFLLSSGPNYLIQYGLGLAIEDNRAVKLTGSDGWNDGAPYSLMIAPLAVGEQAIISYETPRMYVGDSSRNPRPMASTQIFGIFFGSFTTSGFNYLNYCFYYNPVEWLLIRSGQYVGNGNRDPTDSSTANPTLRITGAIVNGQFQYLIEWIMSGFPVRSEYTTNSPTGPIKLGTSLYLAYNGSNMSESPLFTITAPNLIDYVP